MDDPTSVVVSLDELTELLKRINVTFQKAEEQSAPKMNLGEEFECIIAVLYDGSSVVYHAPRPILALLISPFCDENGFQRYPTEQGIYRCQVKFDADPGYESAESIARDDYIFLVREIEPIW